MTSLLLVLGLLASGDPAALVSAEPMPAAPVADTVELPPVQTRALENGLTLLALRRSFSPTASFVVQYRVGGVDEAPGETGMAHLLEHMLFKGTSSLGTRDWEREAPLLARIDTLHRELAALPVGPKGDPARIQLSAALEASEDSARALSDSGEMDRILTRNGARGLNAITTSETTTYLVELPANRAELWFALEGERMADPVLREFYTERDVVLEERRLRVDTDPGGALYEAHLAAAFQEHPYGRPVVGYESDLRALQRSRTLEFFRRFYGARNAVVAVVGDVDPDSVFAWGERYLGSLPPGDTPPPAGPAEPLQTRERRVELSMDAQPAIRMGWHVPGEDHPDTPALHMLATVLTGSRRARLYRSLVEDSQEAISVTAATLPGRLYPGLFVISAVPRSPHTSAEVEARITKSIEGIQARPPEEGELERVRTQLEASRVRRLGSNLGLSLALAEAQTLWGDWRETFRAGERMADVTPEDLQRVARTYLVPGNRTVAWIAPSSKEGEEGPPDRGTRPSEGPEGSGG